MSLLFKRGLLQDLGVPSRSIARAGSVTVTNQNAMTHSAVWACVNRRASLISSLPVDQLRRVTGVQVEVQKDQFFLKPGSTFIGGNLVTFDEWAYATQMDLDRYGNTVGLRSRNGVGQTIRVDLMPAECLSVGIRGGEVEWRIDGKKVDYLDLWHERQYVVPGIPLGLSPVAHAARGIASYLSAQQFALDWFGNGATPGSSLKNTAKKIDGAEAATIKERWREAIANGDVAVLGADWEFSVIAAAASESEFLETQKFSISDVTRFFDFPGDLIDAESSSGSVTYANITQRNVQALVQNLGPAIARRERAWSEAARSGTYVKVNTDAFLRMDPQSREQMLSAKVQSRSITPNEIRELDNRPPLTPAQEAEFARLFNTKSEAPQKVSS